MSKWKTHMSEEVCGWECGGEQVGWCIERMGRSVCWGEWVGS